MIKPARVIQESLVTVFDLNDKEEEYLKFINERQILEAKVKGKFGPEKEAYEKFCRDIFGKLIGDYLENLKIDKYNLWPLYTNGQIVLEGPIFLFAKKEGEEYIGLQPDFTFEALEELKTTLILQLKGNQGHRNMLRDLLDLFVYDNSRYDGIDQPLIQKNGLGLTIASTDFLTPIITLISGLYHFAGEQELKELAQLRNYLDAYYVKGEPLLEVAVSKEYNSRKNRLQEKINKVLARLKEERWGRGLGDRFGRRV